MSLLLFFLHTTAIADNTNLDPFSVLYDRQSAILGKGLLQQDVDHHLPVGEPVPGFIVSQKHTLSSNHKLLGQMLSTENKVLGLEKCDIGLIAYYFLSSADYIELVKDQSVVKIASDYHIFFDDSDSTSIETVRSAYKSVILESCE